MERLPRMVKMEEPGGGPGEGPSAQAAGAPRPLIQ